MSTQDQHQCHHHCPRRRGLAPAHSLAHSLARILVRAHSLAHILALAHSRDPVPLL